MFSKSRINLSHRINESLGLQIHNKQRIVNGALTHNLIKTIPRHKKRRIMGRQKRTLGSGVTSTKSLVPTPMNVSQNND
jgi:hypothetical protein